MRASQTRSTRAQAPAKDRFAQGLLWSSLGHGLLFAFVVFKLVLFPSKTTPYVPTLRVDLVALPDALKKDQAPLRQQKLDQKVSQILEEAEKPIPPAPKEETSKKEVSKPQENAKPKEIAKKDEMVIQPKKIAPAKKIENRNRSTLANFLSTQKIKDSLAQEEEGKKANFKPNAGNHLSPGSSTSAESRENATDSYYGTLRDHLRPYWELPPWLARQKYRAEIELLITEAGEIKKWRFKKASGNAQFDQEIQRTLEKSLPLPIPPEELRSDLLSHGILVAFPL